MKTPFLKERRCLKEKIVDTHGHKLSGAAKMTYIVYLFGKKVDDLDPALVKQGQEYLSKKLAENA